MIKNTVKINIGNIIGYAKSKLHKLSFKHAVVFSSSVASTYCAAKNKDYAAEAQGLRLRLELRLRDKILIICKIKVA